jgi:ADP-heptose:LPS heptosyltransferase
VVSLDRAEIARFFSPRPAIPPEQAAHLRSFHFVLSYLYDPDETLRKNMLGVGVRDVICGSPMVRDAHAVEHLLKPLEALAIYPDGEERPELSLGAELREMGRQRAARLGDRVVAIHPGSGSPKKNWPPDRFAELADRLSRDARLVPLFLIGEAEQGVEEEIRRRSASAPAFLSGCALVELAAVLSACAGYVGNDSGVTHVAASVGIPVVALFGPSNAALWGPRGDRVRILRAAPREAAGMEGISVDAVFQALREMLPD